MSLTRTSATLLLIASAATAQEPATDQLVPVADEETAQATQSPAELLQAEFDRYLELIGEGQLDEADTVAKRVVELSIRHTGPRSLDTSRALTNLAIVQARTGQNEAAQQNYAAAIDIVEEREDRLSPRLINPLKGLGAAQLAGGRPDLAAETYARAVHITHVNEGPHNMDQIELLESLAETKLSMGLIEEAQSAHDSIYSLNLRHYESNPLDLVPSLMRRAGWQHRTGYIFDEQSTYRRIIRIIETEKSKDDIALIEPLTKLGRSYFFQDLSGADPYTQIAPSAGELYIKRALRIARESPQSDWKVLTDALLAIGDYNMFRVNQIRAERYYEEAWDLLSQDENDEERLQERDSRLGQARALRSDPLPRYAGSATNADRLNPEINLREGSITFSYDVSDRGRVENFRVIEANPAEFYDMSRNVYRDLRSRLYRPRIYNGRPVATEGITTTHEFLYKQSDLNELLRNKEAAEEEGQEQATADQEKR